VGTRRVRALLDTDRRAANEARPFLEQTTLQTTDYTVPLRVRLKRSFREDARVRFGSAIASAGIVLVLVGGLVSALGTAQASQAGGDARTLATRDTTRARSATLAVSYQPLASTHETTPPALPVVRDRLQHARRALRAPGVEGAEKARALLEDLLRVRPKSGRAYAALAEACLRLEDAACAHNAVTKAVARQPRRVKYRALAVRINRTFAELQEP
jgi:cytochrome c-type biogenesis protein CcmH/NrfG